MSEQAPPPSLHPKSEPSPASPSSGPLRFAGDFFAEIIHTLQTRLKIITTEIEEERIRLEQIIFLAIGFVFTATLSVIFLTLLVIALAWDTPFRDYVFIAIVIAYLSVATTLGLMLSNRIKNRPPLFETTLRELEKDRERFQ